MTLSAKGPQKSPGSGTWSPAAAGQTLTWEGNSVQGLRSRTASLPSATAEGPEAGMLRVCVASLLLSSFAGGDGLRSVVGSA